MANESICYLKAKGNFLMKPVSRAPPVWEHLFPADYSFKRAQHQDLDVCQPHPFMLRRSVKLAANWF